jgi:hypothetical protein
MRKHHAAIDFKALAELDIRVGDQVFQMYLAFGRGNFRCLAALNLRSTFCGASTEAALWGDQDDRGALQARQEWRGPWGWVRTCSKAHLGRELIGCLSGT